MDIAAFFTSLRRRNNGVFGTSLSQKQVEGMEAILDAGGHLPLTHLAYALATAYGETGGRMQPIQENMNYSAKRIPQVFSPGRLRGHTPAQLAGNPEKLANVVYGGMLGNNQVGDGWKYRGHGLVQLTGKDNFRKFGERIGVDLVTHPERALGMDIAAKALIAGIEEGLYTGVKASDFLPGDYRNARRIINGTFEAEKYAGYARAFEAALKAGYYVPDLLPTRNAPPVSTPTPSTDNPQQQGMNVNTGLALLIGLGTVALVALKNFSGG